MLWHILRPQETAYVAICPITRGRLSLTVGAGGTIRVGDRLRIVEHQKDPSELAYRGLYNSLDS
jgi:hypothetical protein